MDTSPQIATNGTRISARPFGCMGLFYGFADYGVRQAGANEPAKARTGTFGLRSF